MHPTRENRPEKLATWQDRIAREQMVVPSGKGALWTGIGADTAQRLASAKGLITLEMTPLGASLDHGPMKNELVRDFGADWIAEKRLIFRAVSTKFLQSLSGLVTIFLPENLARPRDGAQGSFAFAAKIIWDELRDADFGDPRVAMHRITAMRVYRVRAGQIVSDVLMGSSNQVH